MRKTRPTRKKVWPAIWVVAVFIGLYQLFIAHNTGSCLVDSAYGLDNQLQLLDDSDSSTPLYFLISHKNRCERLGDTIENMNQFTNPSMVHIVVADFMSDQCDARAVVRARSSRIPVRVLSLNEEFSRSRGLHVAAASVEDADALFFTADVDMLFPPDWPTRVRRHSSRGRALFFPVTFTLERDAPTVHSPCTGSWSS